MKQPNADWKNIIEELTVSEEDAGSIVGEDSLLHLEALLVIASSDSEDVSLELLAEDFTIDLLTHSSVEERTATKRVSAQQITRANLGLRWREGLEYATYMYFSSSISIFFWPPVVGSLMLNYRRTSLEPSDFQESLTFISK